ncbi:MAG: hypothetical protein ACKVPX_02650 [Myxococcaceae bacterium]
MRGWVAVGMVLVGCQSAVRSPEQPVVESLPKGDAGLLKPVAVGPSAVSGYLRYLQALREARRSSGKSAHKSGPAALEPETEALRRAGFSEDDLEAIEPVVSGVLARRALGKALALDDARAAYASLKAQLPPERQKDIQTLMDELDARRVELNTLASARARYGDAAVDAVLAQEKPLAEALAAVDP